MMPYCISKVKTIILTVCCVAVKTASEPHTKSVCLRCTGEGMLEVPESVCRFPCQRAVGATGSAIVVSMEGTRPLLVEVQGCWRHPATSGNARCTTNGIEHNRLLMLLAVLTKRVGLAVGNHDVYANVVGGFTVEEPAVDLGVAAAIASSYREKHIPPDMALIGEVGLSGELRAVGRLPLRVREAAKLGFKRCIIPAAGKVHRYAQNWIKPDCPMISKLSPPVHLQSR